MNRNNLNIMYHIKALPNSMILSLIMKIRMCKSIVTNKHLINSKKQKLVITNIPHFVLLPQKRNQHSSVAGTIYPQNLLQQL